MDKTLVVTIRPSDLELVENCPDKRSTRVRGSDRTQMFVDFDFSLRLSAVAGAPNIDFKCSIAVSSIDELDNCLSLRTCWDTYRRSRQNQTVEYAPYPSFPRT